MTRLWSVTEPQSVHDLVERIGQRRKLAYTTVLTVVTKLHDKGWLHREKRQRAYYYFPSRSAAAAQADAVRAALDAAPDSTEALELVAATMTTPERDAVRRGWARSESSIDAD